MLPVRYVMGTILNEDISIERKRNAEVGTINLFLDRNAHPCQIIIIGVIEVVDVVLSGGKELEHGIISR